MLDFKTPKISDRAWVSKCFEESSSMNCEYTFGNSYVWRTAYSSKICHYKDFFIATWGRGNDISYSLPIGKGDFADAIQAIINDAKDRGVVPKIYGVTGSYKERLDCFFENQFNFEFDRGNADYIYLTEKLASLSGKKYHSKRNHISNFIKNNPSWKFERINDNNIKECIECHTEWINSRDADIDDTADYSFEYEAVLDAFENYFDLGFIGGLIRINGKVIAYTFGEKQSDEVFVTHFEKAPGDIQGAYAIINREFAANCLTSFKYVNREEDLNIEGLRKAKLSYNPEIILEKAVAVYVGD